VTSATEPERYRQYVPPRIADPSREAILDAARDLLAEDGVHGLTVRRIAAAAGGSTMNVYSRFGGKEGVVDALVIEGFEQMSACLRRVRNTSDPIADLRRCARAYRTFALSHPTHYDLMFTEPAPDYHKSAEAVRAALAALGILAQRVERAMDAGLIRRGDPWQIAMVFWSACHGPVSIELKQVGPPATDWQGVHDDLFEALIAGLRT
jgi:AcrR family transcriptional regulator